MKILVNRQGAGGDVLMTTPIIRQLRALNPDAVIDFAVNQQHADYVVNNPNINAIHRVLPNSAMIADYDQYYDLDLVYERDPKKHAVHAYADSVFQHRDFDLGLELFTTAQDQELARQFKYTVSGPKYIVLHMRRWPWPSRNLPENFWRQIIDYIHAKSDVTIVQVGSQNEPFFAGKRLIDTRGHFTVHELREVIANAKCYLGTDSAPAHVAGTTATPMVVLYTSVRSEYRQPLRDKPYIPIAADIDCYGCHTEYPAPCTQFICHRGDLECVNRFDVRTIAESVIQHCS
jgi:ADP-heptose:LPS heptosyltransferase